jgi:hypothetical protein
MHAPPGDVGTSTLNCRLLVSARSLLVEDHVSPDFSWQICLLAKGEVCLPTLKSLHFFILSLAIGLSEPQLLGLSYLNHLDNRCDWLFPYPARILI